MENLSVTPSAVNVGDTYTITGTGFEPGVQFTLQYDNPGHGGMGIVPNANGEFSFSEVASFKGDYAYYHATVKGKGKKVTIVSQVAFTVS